MDGYEARPHHMGAKETGRASGATGYLVIERGAGFAFASRKVRMPLGGTSRKSYGGVQDVRFCYVGSSDAQPPHR